MQHNNEVAACDNAYCFRDFALQFGLFLEVEALFACLISHNIDFSLDFEMVESRSTALFHPFARAYLNVQSQVKMQWLDNSIADI